MHIVLLFGANWIIIQFVHQVGSWFVSFIYVLKYQSTDINENTQLKKDNQDNAYETNRTKPASRSHSMYYIAFND